MYIIAKDYYISKILLSGFRRLNIHKAILNFIRVIDFNLIYII